MIVAWYETMSGGTPTPANAAQWANTYNATYPFLADANGTLLWALERDMGIPSYSLVAPGLEFVAVDSYSVQGQIENYLPY